MKEIALSNPTMTAINALSDLAAAPGGEPIAYLTTKGDYRAVGFTPIDEGDLAAGFRQTPLYASPAAETAPDAGPVGYVFELARVWVGKTGEYRDWGKPQFSFTAPHAADGSIRNVRPLYTAPPKAPDAGLVEALRNLLGCYDTPVERRRRGDDPFYAEAIAMARAALSRAGEQDNA
jgi:hypothetical protein